MLWYGLAMFCAAYLAHAAHEVSVLVRYAGALFLGRLTPTLSNPKPMLFASSSVIGHARIAAALAVAVR